MRTETKAKLAKSSSGRVILHLAALYRDHRLSWHLAGVLREFFLKNR